MKYQICTKCVLDTTMDGIKFDLSGICVYCNSYKKNVVNKKLDDNQKIFILDKIVKKIKNKTENCKYNCIIGVSGGLDSSYLIHYVVKELNLKPLIYHVDTGWNSNTSVSNIEKIIDKLQLDLVTDVIDWKEIKDLTLSYFKAGVTNLDNVQDHAIFGSLYNFVEKENFKYIITGANLQSEFIRPPMSWCYHASDSVQIKDIQNRYGTIKIKSFPYYDIFKSKFYLKMFKRVKMVYPLNFINYTKESAIKLLKEQYDWLPYARKHHESRFTAFYENYWSLKRFGHDRRRTTFSGLILSGQMTREEAIKKIQEEPLSKNKIEEEINYICSKLEISREQLDNFMNLEKKSFLDYKNNYKIINFFTQILRFFNIEKRVF